MLLKEFLERVLPAEGYKCWVSIDQNKKVIQGLVPTIGELAAKLQEIDARGSDAYFACASYKTPQSRRAANVHSVKAFWMDIDAGERKFYANADDAIQACDDFCDRANLPLPELVQSGNGIHAYWLLAQPIAVDAWHSIAQRLKLLTINYGLQADPSRTADIASILRPPSTKNYKLPGQARSVEIDSEDGWEPVDTVKFIECVLQAASSAPAGRVPGGSETKAPPANAALLGGLSTQQAFDPAESVPESGGRYGGRNNACAAYAGSLLRKNHTVEDALRLCLEWNVARCQPPLPDQEIHTTVRSIYRRELESRPVPILPTAWNPPTLPHGFRFNESLQMLAKVKEMDKSGTEVDAWRIMSDYPVYPVVFLNQEGHAKKNSYLLIAYSPVTGWNEFCLDAETVNGRDFYAKLVENGVTLASGMDKHFKTFIREMERMMRKEQEITRYSQFGWKPDGSFLVGNVLMKAGQPAKAYGTDRMTGLMNTMIVPLEASLERWTEEADKFFAPGLEPHAFALLCSFAAPLIKFCAGMSDGGSILSLVSEDSGRGKTPVAEAIASVWGELGAAQVTGNFTQNRLVEELVRRCNMPVVQEENIMADPTVATESVKQFTMGCGRGRLNQRGEAKEIPERYQTIWISISNISLHSLVAPVDRAASRRIMEVQIPKLEKETLANIGGITREMMAHRAVAGRRYIQILTMPEIGQYLSEHLTGQSKEQAGGTVMHYRRLLETEPEHRFLVWLLSCVHVAAILLTHYGILHFNVERIMAWAVKAALETKTDMALDDPLNRLTQFLSEHIDCCLVVKESFNIAKGPCAVMREPSRRLYMRLEMEPGRLLISQVAFSAWCEQHRIVVRALGIALEQRKIVLSRSRQLSLNAGTSLPGGRQYCWEVDMKHPDLCGILRDVAAEPQNISASQTG